MTFFLLVSIAATLCILVFINSQYSMFEDVELFTENARKTMLLVVVMSLIITIIDEIRRRIMTEKPVKKIREMTRKIVGGDFSAKAEPLNEILGYEGYNKIIEDINSMAEELSGVETLRTEFIANVSHELKTPLAAIQNYATMLQSPELDEKTRVEYARSITETTRRLSRLISNILKLNRLENQQIFPEKKEYYLGEQLCECLLNFESEWEKKNLEIVTDIDEEIKITADSELLSIVWNNLFSNAVKFTENGGRISLSLRGENGCAVVCVTDTGCGISPETGRHIFEKFYQGNASHAAHGNGLGLALVKRIIDITGGEISVESALGKGSAFTVKLKENGYEKTAS